MAPTQPLPAAFDHIIDDPNRAVDAALVEALPDLGPLPQAVALEMLVQRDHDPALARLVALYPQTQHPLRGLLAAHAESLATGIRTAIASPEPDRRAAAIRLIVDRHAWNLAYLLAEVLRADTPETRALAAAGLLELAIAVIDAPNTRQTVPPPAIDRLAAAIGAGLQRWETHRERAILDAALLLGDRAEPSIRRKLDQPRNTLQRALSDLLATTRNPAHAAFALRAVAIQPLRPAAVRAITRATDPDFLRALLEAAWLLADERIEKGCRWLTAGNWIEPWISILVALDDEALPPAVHLFAALGGSPEQKAGVSRTLVDCGDDRIVRLAVWRLTEDESDAATQLLRMVAARTGTAAARIAAREVRRRRRKTGPTPAPPRPTPPAAPTGARAIVESLRDRWDDLSPHQRRTAASDLAHHRNDVIPALRRALASTDPADRLGTIDIIATAELADDFSTELRRLCGDTDPLVRAATVRLLPKVPEPWAARALRQAVNDPDDRVQANAVEALEHIADADRAAAARPKLDAAHHRVRANAIRSLLELKLADGAEALLRMLDDASAAHRISALWVVERMHLDSVLDEVRALSTADPDPRVRARAARLLRIFRECDTSDAAQEKSEPTADARPREAGNLRPVAPQSKGPSP